MRSNRAEHAAALLDVRPPVPGPSNVCPRIRSKSQLDVLYFSDVAGSQQFAHLQTTGKKSQLVIDEREDAGLPGTLCHAPRFIRVHCHGFFAQHMLALVE